MGQRGQLGMVLAPGMYVVQEANMCGDVHEAGYTRGAYVGVCEQVF